jgi:hypothetical protein
MSGGGYGADASGSTLKILGSQNGRLALRASNNVPGAGAGEYLRTADSGGFLALVGMLGSGARATYASSTRLSHQAEQEHITCLRAPAT